MREIAYAIARTIGFVLAALAASGQIIRAVVLVAATLTVSMIAAVAGAIAAIVWAIVWAIALGLWSVMSGTARLLVAGSARAAASRPPSRSPGTRSPPAARGSFSSSAPPDATSRPRSLVRAP